MNVLMISPGFPAEMPFFTEGLASVGANVIGIGDQPLGALPDRAQKALSAYVRVGSLWDEGPVIDEVRKIATQTEIHVVECLWEPGMILAAKIREMLRLPGMTVQETLTNFSVMACIMATIGLIVSMIASSVLPLV